MLTDDEKYKKLPSKKGWKRWYTDAEKLEAVKLYLLTGNQAATAAALNMHKNTMSTWVNSQWFKDMADQLKYQGNIQLSGKLKKIAEKAQIAVEDRIEHGDWIYDQKTGEMRRKPISARDAAKVATDFLDKAWQIEDKVDKGKVEEQTQDRLAQLAEAFAKFANKTTKVEVIDVVPVERETKEITDAVPTQR